MRVRIVLCFLLAPVGTATFEAIWETEPVTVVRIATQEDATEVGRVLADGFGQDPVFNWVLDEQHRDHKLEAFFGFLAREALVPLGATYVLPGSCAAWTPPGTAAWPDERSERFRQLFAGTWAAIEIERLGILDEAMQEHHPQEDVWYLSSLATVTEARGRGLASALLEASLRRVDASALAAYLESSNPRNRPLYERHGFRTTGEIELPDGPTLTTMMRRSEVH